MQKVTIRRGNGAMTVKPEEVHIPRQLLRKYRRGKCDERDIANLVAITAEGVYRMLEDQGRKQFKFQVNRLLRLVTAYTLHDKFGWGKQRLDRLMDCIDIVIEDLQETRIEPEEIEKIMLNECNFRVEGDNDVTEV